MNKRELLIELRLKTQKAKDEWRGLADGAPGAFGRAYGAYVAYEDALTLAEGLTE